MYNRPFQFGVRALPNGAEDSLESLTALLAECQAELEVIDQLAPLRLCEMEGQGRGELERLKEQYQAEGRYGEACIERQADLATYLFRMRKRIKLDKALRKRGLGYLWDAFEQIKAQVDELDPIVWDALGGGGRPDNISDGLAQGIGVREIL